MNPIENETAAVRIPLREALRLSIVVVDVQRHLTDACAMHPGVDIGVVSEPKHLDLEHRGFAIVDRTGGKERIVFGPVPYARLDDLAGVARAGSRRWVEAHTRRRNMRVVGADA